MSRSKLEENVGEIVIQNDKNFWIFPKRYIRDRFFRDTDIYSPWFSYLSEKWQFVISPNLENLAMRNFYLWRKFRCHLPGYEYTLQLKLKTYDGEQIAFSEYNSKCDYGFQVLNFCSRETLLNPNIAHCQQIKIFFTIKEKCHSEDEPSSISAFVEKNNHDDINQEGKTSSDDEISSDEENSEKKRSMDKGIKRLLQHFRQMFLHSTMSDVILKVDGRDFNVHKAVLIARSPVFAPMFTHDVAEKDSNVVNIPDCTAESFEVFLRYVYYGSAETLTTSNMYNVYYASDKYQVNDLKKKCVKFMIRNMSVETFCDMFALSLLHGESNLQKIATGFFSQNKEKVLKSVQWQRYITENPISANELFIKSCNAE